MGRNDDGLYRQQLIDALLKQGIVTPGNIYYLDPTNGSDSNDGLSIDQAFAGMPTAYAALTAGQHDILFYVAGSTSLSLAATVTWAKDYTHFIGVSAPTFMAQRSRIFHSANFSPGITISASGCIFKNFYFSYGRGGADNHIAVTLTGDRNYFENVHFAGMNHATEAADAASVGLQMTGASENLFKHCTFGNDTIARTGANASVALSTSCARNKMVDCLFESRASGATAVHLRVDATGVDRILWLHNCIMVNHGTTMTQAIDSNITDSTNRKILITGRFTVVGATDVADATGDGTIFMERFTATANVLGLTINPAAS